MRCFFCHNYSFKNYPLCANCESQILSTKLQGNSCVICGQTLLESRIKCASCSDKTSIDELLGIFYYEGKAKRLMQAYKFEGLFSMSHFWASLIETRLQVAKKDHQLVAVPPKPGKQWINGKDQIQRILTLLTKENYKPLKRKIGPSQKWLNRKDRQTNMLGKFHYTKDQIKKHIPILLLDDIRTTGATLEEAASTLKNAGVLRVDAMVLFLD